MQAHIFDSWTALVNDPNTSERAQQTFASKLGQPDSGLFASDETFALFMRTCIEKWYGRRPGDKSDKYMRFLMRYRRAHLVVPCSITDNLVAVHNVYQSTDALARLVLFLARAQAEPLAIAHATAGAGPARPLVRRWRSRRGLRRARVG